MDKSENTDLFNYFFLETDERLVAKVSNFYVLWLLLML
jgi:hypothetical protein